MLGTGVHLTIPADGHDFVLRVHERRLASAGLGCNPIPALQTVQFRTDKSARIVYPSELAPAIRASGQLLV